MKHKILNIIILLFVSYVGFAQTRTITGTVKDRSNNEPLTGAAVSIKGTTRGMSVDANGEFSLSNVSSSDTLEVSFIGYITQTIPVGNRNVIEVLLNEDVTTLAETVVVAFAQQKKQNVVTSVQSVRPADLVVPASNLSTALAGRIPGLISYVTSGEPGADNSQFFVRGVSTFGYKASPLILIDGFEMSEDDFARLQVDDIESFSILKDASAAVLYGSRASNGIIMVNTKKGVDGPVKLNIRVDNHIATPTKVPKMTDGVTYMRMYNEARMTRDPLLGPFYNEQKIQSTRDGLNPMIFPNVNWYDEIFKSQTFNTKVNLNVQGGGAIATYYVAGGYDHETGLLNVDPNNTFTSNININRFHIRTNVTFKLTSTTTLETQIYGQFEKYIGPQINTRDIFRAIMASNPVDFPAVYEPDAAHQYVTHTLFGATLAEGLQKVNPYAEMVRGYSDRNESTVTAQATLMQDLKFITEGLRFQVNVSVKPYSKYTSTRRFVPYYYDLESYNMLTGDYKLWCLNPTNTGSNLGNIEPERDGSFRYYLEGRLSWVRQFNGKHNLGAMAVGTMEENLLTAGSSTSIYETLPERNSGISGRLTYDYDSRFFIEAAFGYNGSEKFEGGRRFGFYPSVAGGWIISNEPFWEPLKKTISMLKLKGSIGKLGNDAIAKRADRFFYLSDITQRGFDGNNPWDYGYRWGESLMNTAGGYTINRYANPYITWEVTTDWNAGLEVSLFKNEKLKLQAEIFGKDRKQIYMQRENFPATAGLEASVSGNVGALKAFGYEGSLDYQHSFSKDFYVTARANITYSDNEYTQLDEKDYADKYRKRLGHNSSQRWGYIAERLFVDAEEIANSPRQTFGEYMAGDIKYKDINGDGVVNENDQVPLGYPTNAKMQYGFGVSTGYKHFDFSFFFSGNAFSSFFINATSSASDNDGDGIAPFAFRRNALDIVARDYWSETNPNVYAFWPRLSTVSMLNNQQQSTWWLRDGSYLQLKSLEIGYRFQEWKKIDLKNARVYVSFDNVLTFSKFKLWDVTLGANGFRYPPNKRFNLGLQFSF